MKTQSNISRRIHKIFALILSFLLIFEQSGFAQTLPLPWPIVADTFRPLHLRYLSYDDINNNFRLLLDKGSTLNPQPEEITDTTKQLLNYFSVGLALSSESFWVNLRPDGESNIIDSELARTDVGRVMLEADLQLKKDTALSTSPNTPEGKAYWDRLYKKAGELFGSENVTIPTLTRVWIVPAEIVIGETSASAYIYKATLKVLLEQDYLKDSSLYNFKDAKEKALNDYSSQLFRETIIPKLTREVNASKRYAPLRQVYYSLIMAEWFKARFQGKRGTYPDLINSKNLAGLTSQEPWSKTTYFKAYQKSVNEGEYNIQETQDVAFSLFHQATKRYVCGGVLLTLAERMPGALGGIKYTAGTGVQSLPSAINHFFLKLRQGLVRLILDERGGIKISPTEDSDSEISPAPQVAESNQRNIAMAGLYQRDLRVRKAKGEELFKGLTANEINQLAEELVASKNQAQTFIDFFRNKGIDVSREEADKKINSINALSMSGLTEEQVGKIERELWEEDSFGKGGLPSGLEKEAGIKQLKEHLKESINKDIDSEIAQINSSISGRIPILGNKKIEKLELLRKQIINDIDACKDAEMAKALAFETIYPYPFLWHNQNEAYGLQRALENIRKESDALVALESNVPSELLNEIRGQNFAIDNILLSAAILTLIKNSKITHESILQTLNKLNEVYKTVYSSLQPYSSDRRKDILERLPVILADTSTPQKINLLPRMITAVHSFGYSGGNFRALLDAIGTEPLAVWEAWVEYFEGSKYSELGLIDFLQKQLPEIMKQIGGVENYGERLKALPKAKSIEGALLLTALPPLVKNLNISTEDIPKVLNELQDTYKNLQSNQYEDFLKQLPAVLSDESALQKVRSLPRVIKTIKPYGYYAGNLRNLLGGIAAEPFSVWEAIIKYLESREYSDEELRVLLDTLPQAIKQIDGVEKTQKIDLLLRIIDKLKLRSSRYYSDNLELLIDSIKSEPLAVWGAATDFVETVEYSDSDLESIFKHTLPNVLKRIHGVKGYPEKFKLLMQQQAFKDRLMLVDLPNFITLPNLEAKLPLINIICLGITNIANDKVDPKFLLEEINNILQLFLTDSPVSLETCKRLLEEFAQSKQEKAQTIKGLIGPESTKAIAGVIEIAYLSSILNNPSEVSDFVTEISRKTRNPETFGYLLGSAYRTFNYIKTGQSQLEKFKAAAEFITRFADKPYSKDIIDSGLLLIGDSINSGQELLSLAATLEQIAQMTGGNSKSMFENALPAIKDLIPKYGLAPFIQIIKLGGEGAPFMLQSRPLVNELLAMISQEKDIFSAVNQAKVMVASGQFDINDHLHCLANYLLIMEQLKTSSVRRQISYDEFLGIIEDARKGGSSLEKEDFPPKVTHELRGVVYEAYLLRKKILQIREAARKLGRKVLVVENLSYGAVAASPIIDQTNGHRFIAGTDIEVISTKVGSTESHHNEFVLIDDLFNGEQQKMLMEENPIVVVIDASTSVADPARTSPHIPDGFKGYRNYFMALTEAAWGRVQAEDFYEDNGFLKGLRQTGTFRQLVSRLQKSGAKASSQEGYKFYFWYPGNKELFLRVNKTKDFSAKGRKLDDAGILTGPAVVFVQSALEPEAITEKWAMDFIKGKDKQYTPYEPAYFDDKDNFKQFHFAFEEGSGVVLTNKMKIAAREYYRRLAIQRGEEIKPLVTAAPKEGDILPVDTVVADLDGVLALTDEPLSVDSLKLFAGLVNKGKRLILVTEDLEENLGTRVINLLPPDIRRSIVIFSDGGTKGYGFDEKGAKVYYEDYNQKSRLVSGLREKIIGILESEMNLRGQFRVDDRLKRISPKYRVDLYQINSMPRDKFISQARAALTKAGINAKLYKSGKTSVRIVLQHKEEALRYCLDKFGLAENKTLILEDSARTNQIGRGLLTSFRGAISVNVGTTAKTIGQENPEIIQLAERGIDGARILIASVSQYGGLSRRYLAPYKIDASSLKHESTSQIGKRAKVANVIIKNDGKHYLVVADAQTNKVLKEIELTKADNEGLINTLTDLVDSVNPQYKQLLEAFLEILKTSPPEFYTYSVLIKDLFGYADTGFIALHQGFANNPAALFHELGEYLIKSGLLHLYFQENNIIVSLRASTDEPFEETRTVNLSKDTLQFIEEEGWKDWHSDNHYLLRVLQRQAIEEKDKALTQEIERVQEQVQRLDTPAVVSNEAEAAQRQKIPSRHINRYQGDLILPRDRFGAEINLIDVIRDVLKAELGTVPLFSVIGSSSYAFDEAGQRMWDVISDFDVRIHTEAELSNERYDRIKRNLYDSLQKLGANVEIINKVYLKILDLTGKSYGIQLIGTKITDLFSAEEELGDYRTTDLFFGDTEVLNKTLESFGVDKAVEKTAQNYESMLKDVREKVENQEFFDELKPKLLKTLYQLAYMRGKEGRFRWLLDKYKELSLRYDENAFQEACTQAFKDLDIDKVSLRAELQRQIQLSASGKQSPEARLAVASSAQQLENLGKKEAREPDSEQKQQKIQFEQIRPEALSEAQKQDILQQILEVSEVFPAGQQRPGEDYLSPRLFSGGAMFFVAKSEDKIVGYIFGKSLMNYGNQPGVREDKNYKNAAALTMYVEIHAVLKDYENKGIGKSLMDKFVSEAFAEGYRAVTLHVRQGSAEKLGAKVVSGPYQNWGGSGEAYEYCRFEPETPQEPKGPATQSPGEGKGTESPKSKPSRLPPTSATGGIDFRNLPIVKKAIGNLKPDIRGSAINKLKDMNLDTEWQDIENLVNQGVIPRAGRLREYIQASCLNGNAGQDIDKVISCIADILRLEEERYLSTEPMLIDILIAVESANSVQQLKAAFIGN